MIKTFCLDSGFLRNCGIAGGFESLKEGILLFAKAKSSKNFYAPRASLGVCRI